MSELMTVDQVADYLQVSRWTVYRWRSLGEGPPSMKVGGAVRYRRTDVDAWLEARTQQAV